MKKLAMTMAMVAVCATVAAQGPNIYFGLGTGFHSNKMKYSDINETLYPEKDIQENERYLEGFLWREEERPKSKEDL